MGENEKNGDLQKTIPKKQGESSKSQVPCYVAMGIGAGLAFFFLFKTYFGKGEPLWVSLLGFIFVLFSVYSCAAASHICGSGLEKFYPVLLVEFFLIIAAVGYLFSMKDICGRSDQIVATLIFSIGGTIVGALVASIKDVSELLKGIKDLKELKENLKHKGETDR